MFHLLVPILSWLIDLALKQLPPDADMGDQLIELILLLIGKAVTMTTTDVDDALFEQVATALRKDIAES